MAPALESLKEPSQQRNFFLPLHDQSFLSAPFLLSGEITYPSMDSVMTIHAPCSLPSRVLIGRPLLSQKLCLLQEEALRHADIFTSFFHGKVLDSYSSRVRRGHQQPSGHVLCSLPGPPKNTYTRKVCSSRQRSDM